MKHGDTMLGSAGANEQTKADWARRKQWTQTAIVVLVVGFLLQIASNFVPVAVAEPPACSRDLSTWGVKSEAQRIRMDDIRYPLLRGFDIVYHAQRIARPCVEGVCGGR